MGRLTPRQNLSEEVRQKAPQMEDLRLVGGLELRNFVGYHLYKKTWVIIIDTLW